MLKNDRTPNNEDVLIKIASTLKNKHPKEAMDLILSALSKKSISADRLFNSSCYNGGLTILGKASLCKYYEIILLATHRKDLTRLMHNKENTLLTYAVAKKELPLIRMILLSGKYSKNFSTKKEVLKESRINNLKIAVKNLQSTLPYTSKKAYQEIIASCDYICREHSGYLREISEYIIGSDVFKRQYRSGYDCFKNWHRKEIARYIKLSLSCRINLYAKFGVKLLDSLESIREVLSDNFNKSKDAEIFKLFSELESSLQSKSFCKKSNYQRLLPTPELEKSDPEAELAAIKNNP